jgi:gliding motility-associated-like protein
MKSIQIIFKLLLLASSVHSQGVLESYDFFSGSDQFQVTNDNSINGWCFESSIYSIDGYSLQICSNGAVGYSGANGNSAICYFNINATNYSNMTLEFDWRCNGETNLDFGKVFFSVSGTNTNTPIWSELATNLQTGDNSINHAILKLPLIANNKGNLKIGFSFESDSYFNFQPGFVIDNIQLKGFNCVNNYPMSPAQQEPFVTCRDAVDLYNLTVQQLTGFSYRWYRDESQSFFHTGGSYSASRYYNQSYIVTSLNSNGCESRSPHTVVSLMVRSNPSIDLVELAGTTVGNDGAIEIEVSGTLEPYNILWQSVTNDTLAMNTLRIDSLNADLYKVQVTDANSCDSLRFFQVEEGSTIIVPSAFSPNGDGLNDFWVLEGIEQWDDFDISVATMNNRIIHSQKGNLSNRKYIAWDGSNMNTNEPVPDGDYIYVLYSIEKQREYRGIVSIKTK